MSSMRIILCVCSILLGLLALSSNAAPVLNGNNTEAVKTSGDGKTLETAQVAALPSVQSQASAKEQAKEQKTSNKESSLPLTLDKEENNAVKRFSRLEKIEGMKEDKMPIDYEEDVEQEVKGDDEEEYIKTLLDNPSLLKQFLDEDTQVDYDPDPVSDEFGTKPNDMALSGEFGVKPQDMAGYWFATGDEEGVSRMIDNLVLYGALTASEASDFRLAVEAEYSLLNGVAGRLVNRFDVLEPASEIAPVNSDSEYNTGDEFSRNYFNGPDFYNYKEQEQDYPYYDEILKELLGYLPPSDLVSQKGGDRVSTLKSESNTDSKLNSIFENELKALPFREENNSKGKSEEEKQLADTVLLKQASSNSVGKQTQDNRTKVTKGASPFQASSMSQTDRKAMA